MKVFASCSTYVLGCLEGPQRATQLVTNAVAKPYESQVLLAVHALRELRALADPLLLSIDGGSSHLAKSRSRQFASALDSDADVWVTIDDDVDATRETLAWMLNVVEAKYPCICIVPCPLRTDPGIVNVEFSPLYAIRALPNAGKSRICLRGGFGLVAMNRPAMNEVSRVAPSWKDDRDGGKLKPAAFLEMLKEDGRWLGEDLAFFERVPSTVQVEALVTGEVLHAGFKLDLSLLQ